MCTMVNCSEKLSRSSILYTMITMSNIGIHVHIHVDLIAAETYIITTGRIPISG